MAAESIPWECEWEAQIKTQTKPLPLIDDVAGQSQNAGKDAVKELLQLRKTRDRLKKQEREYDVLVEDEATPMDEYTEAKADLESVHLHLQACHQDSE
ncbi:hypothetical protein DXG01_014282 [Tephrocybe rancida]|nr:hypothetical protein DXG01_014282 [Tephrocybe rancida]